MTCRWDCGGENTETHILYYYYFKNLNVLFLLPVSSFSNIQHSSEPCVPAICWWRPISAHDILKEICCHGWQDTLCLTRTNSISIWIATWGDGTPLQYSCLENPWTEEPGRLQSMGLLRVEHDWVTSLSLFTFMNRRRKWQPTPVFLPGESQGQRSLVGFRLWGRTESDTTDVT